MSDQGIGLVVFDWAGTLVDCGSSAPVEAFAAAFEEFGLPVSEDEIRRFMGASKREHVQSLLSLPRVQEAWRRRDEGPMDLELLDGLYERFLEHQKAVVRRSFAFTPDAFEALAALSERGIAVGTTTGYPRAVGELIISAARDAGFRSVLDVCTDDVPEGRPAPWMIYRCMEAARVSPVARVLKVGDTEIDVAAGRRAGSWTAVVTLTGSEAGWDEATFRRATAEERDEVHERVSAKARSWGAHTGIRTLRELPGLIDALNRKLTEGVRPEGCEELGS